MKIEKTTLLTALCLAAFVSVTTSTSFEAPVLAQDDSYKPLPEFGPNSALSGLGEGGNRGNGNNDEGDSPASDNNAYVEFQTCLSDVEGGREGSLTEQEVQDCFESSYGGEENTKTVPGENTDASKDGSGDAEPVLP
jgi:hypothetical protein